MKEFAGRIAVVTGGGSGMGRELVRQLVAEGCNVSMCDIPADSLESQPTPQNQHVRGQSLRLEKRKRGYSRVIIACISGICTMCSSTARTPAIFSAAMCTARFSSAE